MQVFVWGCNYWGQLGFGDEALYKMITDPTELIAPDGTTWAQIVCGVHNTAAVSNNGEVFTWGSGIGGNLGHGDLDERAVPTKALPTKVKIPGGEAVVKVACGTGHTAAVTSTGKIFTWYVSCYYALN